MRPIQSYKKKGISQDKKMDNNNKESSHSRLTAYIALNCKRLRCLFLAIYVLPGNIYFMFLNLILKYYLSFISI